MTTACRKAKESSLHNPASRFLQTYKSSRRALLRRFPYSAGFARGRNRAQRRIGWVMAMVYDDHNPPHFHAEYGEHEVLEHQYIGHSQWQSPGSRSRTQIGRAHV